MNLENDILIERFLRNELSEEEKKSFLIKVDEDADFKSHFLLEKQLFESLNENEWSFVSQIQNEELNEYEALFKSDEIQQLKSVIKNASKQQKRNKRSVIQLISGIAAAVVIGVFLLKPVLNSTPDSNNLYASYVSKETLPSFIERGEGDTNQQLIEAETLFKAEKYNEASAKFKTFITTNSSVSGAYIYAALAEVELGNFESAIEVLEKLKTSDLIDAEKANWYVSLVYIKANNLKKAKKELESIISSNGYNSMKAKELLKEL